MELTENRQTVLNSLPVGARLLIRSKTDWRSAVVSHFDAEKATLIVCSPSGRTYRLRRMLEAEIIFDGLIPILKIQSEEDWRENFTKYDFRWWKFFDMKTKAFWLIKQSIILMIIWLTQGLFSIWLIFINTKIDYEETELQILYP